ncbi:MAG: hypothetical protein HZA15_00985 [Nitrospirae bacterium]|nr:hypothetical protein [Nitrospirota bacterium]
MIGTKIYIKKSRLYLFLLLYGLLALAGVLLIAQSFSRNEALSGSVGFMVIFGAGMFIMTLIKSRQPQVSVHKDFLEVYQSRTKQLIRYRNIIGIDRPDKKRLVITLHEDHSRKDMTIWLKELEEGEIDKLAAFLSQEKGRSR